jgi:hypothetical protein
MLFNDLAAERRLFRDCKAMRWILSRIGNCAESALKKERIRQIVVEFV